MYKYKNKQGVILAYTLHTPTANYPINGIYLHLAIIFLLMYLLPVMVDAIA